MDFANFYIILRQKNEFSDRKFKTQHFARKNDFCECRLDILSAECRKMRKSLARAFDEIYILNLHGDEKDDENVFDIRVGVCISLFVKYKENSADSGDTLSPPPHFQPRKLAFYRLNLHLK